MWIAQGCFRTPDVLIDIELLIHPTTLAVDEVVTDVIDAGLHVAEVFWVAREVKSNAIGVGLSRLRYQITRIVIQPGVALNLRAWPDEID